MILLVLSNTPLILYHLPKTASIAYGIDNNKNGFSKKASIMFPHKSWCKKRWIPHEGQ